MVKYDLIKRDGFRRGRIRSLKANAHDKLQLDAIVEMSIHVKFNRNRAVCDAKDYANVRCELEASKIDSGVKVGEEAEFKLDSLNPNRAIQIRALR